MPKCMVCAEKFSRWEDCACGENLSRELESEFDPQDIQDMRDHYRNELLNPGTGWEEEEDGET